MIIYVHICFRFIFQKMLSYVISPCVYKVMLHTQVVASLLNVHKACNSPAELDPVEILLRLLNSPCEFPVLQ